MNTTTLMKNLPPDYRQIGIELSQLFVYLLVPFELLHLSLYFHLKGRPQVDKLLTFLTLATLWACPIIVPVYCPLIHCVQNFIIAVGGMKTLDLFFRRHSLPKYTADPPPDYKLALLYATELRYESFTPNQIRTPLYLQNFSEPMQLAIHILVFSILEAIPYRHPSIIALEIEYAIYILWTTMQLILRYKTSPALFGPLYAADSISGFWSETWHNVFSAPSMTLAYYPLRGRLQKLGMPIGLARAAGLLGAFVFMAIFHVYAMIPIMDDSGLLRVFLFFIINGLGSVVDVMVWQKRRHWLRAVLAWVFELSISGWAYAGMGLPTGLRDIDWMHVCKPCMQCTGIW